MTITSQQVDAWDAEVDAAYASGVAAGAAAERALWELSRLGQEIEAQPEQHDRRLQIAMRQWEDWKAYALDLQKKLVKYEGGSPMILNTRSEQGWTPERIAGMERLKAQQDSRTEQGTWVGLTDEELAELSASGLVLWGLWRAIEAKLKEKNFD